MTEEMEIRLRQELVDRKIEISQMVTENARLDELLQEALEMHRGKSELLTKAERKINDLTAMLEEILEYCQDNYDVDPDPSGGHHDVPNWYMRTGTEIEETLGRGGRYGF